MAGTRTMFALQLALILSALAAQCCVLRAEECKLDPARLDAMFEPLNEQLKVFKMNVDKHLATCSGAELPEAGPVCESEGPMGMEDGRIPDSSITASSYQNDNYAPYKGRLNNEYRTWARRGGDANPWVQVDFKTQVYITGVITQGAHYPAGHFVREYQIGFSQDGSTWTRVGDDKNDKITFQGHTSDKNGNTEVTNRLPAPVKARFLRIYPTKAHIFPEMRFEVIGCDPASDQP